MTRATGYVERRRSLAGAFSLAELMIVISIIALLIAIVAPTAGRAVEMSRSLVCKNQMCEMGTSLRVEGASSEDLRWRIGVSVPDSTHWEAVVVEAGLVDLTICPSDNQPLDNPYEGLKDLYFHQSSSEEGHYGEFDTSLYAMLNGEEPPDKQVCYMYQNTTYVGKYYDSASYDWSENLAVIGGKLNDNQLLMSAGSGAIVLTFHDTYVSIYEYDVRPDWTAEYGHLIGSDHYLCQGSSENWEDDIIRTFIGKNSLVPAKPFINLAKISYGMNSRVRNLNPSLGQIWLVEYCRGEMNLHRPTIDSPFDRDPDNGEIMPRHLGKANVMFVGGSVRSMSGDELEAEYARAGNLFQP